MAYAEQQGFVDDVFRVYVEQKLVRAACETQECREDIVRKDVEMMRKFDGAGIKEVQGGQSSLLDFDISQKIHYHRNCFCNSSASAAQSTVKKNDLFYRLLA